MAFYELIQTLTYFFEENYQFNFRNYLPHVKLILAGIDTHNLCKLFRRQTLYSKIVVLIKG
jgi:hypothetical protein